MAARILLAVAIVSVLAGRSWAQTVPGEPATAAASPIPRGGLPARRPWRRSWPPPRPPTCPAGPSPASPPAPAALPNEHGQIWREYDISPYTARVTTTKRPEQAIVDWILRETGYEVWHSEPLGVLSATPRTLRVYHTPEMQAVVADVVDRFVASEAQSQTFSLRVMTVGQPQLAGPGPERSPARARADARRQRVAVAARGRGGRCWPNCSAAPITASTARRTCWSTTGNRPWSPCCGRGPTSAT